MKTKLIVLITAIANIIFAATFYAIAYHSGNEFIFIANGLRVIYLIYCILWMILIPLIIIGIALAQEKFAESAASIDSKVTIGSIIYYITAAAIFFLAVKTEYTAIAVMTFINIIFNATLRYVKNLMIQKYAKQKLAE